MGGPLIFKIPFVERAVRTPHDERSSFQRVLVSISNLWLHFTGRLPWNALKYDVTTFRGQHYHETLVDFRTWELYDRDGYLYGWYGQDYEGFGFFKTFAEEHGDEPRPRMRWFSRLRSPKLPSANQAEVISGGEVVGHTTFKIVR